jgi:hypothetical protein
VEGDGRYPVVLLSFWRVESGIEWSSLGEV